MTPSSLINSVEDCLEMGETHDGIFINLTTVALVPAQTQSLHISQLVQFLPQ